MDWQAIIIGMSFGFIIRLLLLRVDYRQYPSYPHGYLTHLALGFIASAVGAVAVPALVAKDYAAATFLVLVATQFRDVRDMERSSLHSLERSELVPRGSAYIEGIARVFEARNYLIMGVALLTSVLVLLHSLAAGVVGGLVSILAAYQIRRGQTIGDIAEVTEGKLVFNDAQLFVNNIFLMNIGLNKIREEILEQGIGILVWPLSEKARNIISNPGQRQAIVHDVTAILGTRMDVDTPEFTPMSRRDSKSGCVGFFVVTAERDVSAVIEATKRVPVLESTRAVDPDYWQKRFS